MSDIIYVTVNDPTLEVIELTVSDPTGDTSPVTVNTPTVDVIDLTVSDPEVDVINLTVNDPVIEIVEVSILDALKPGTTLHSELTDITTDDHHARLHSLNTHSDVNAPTPSDQNALIYDLGTGRWIPSTIDFAGYTDTAITNHESAGDPHAQYLTPAEGDALFLTPAEGNAAYDALGAATTAQSNAEAHADTEDGVHSTADRLYSDGLITTHEAAGDPHAQYLTPVEGDAAYDIIGAAAAAEAAAILSANTEDDNHSTADRAYADGEDASHSTADRAYADGEDASHSIADRLYSDGLITTHEAAGDPHAQYLTPVEGDALFLTPAEGDAAYSPLSHITDALDAHDASAVSFIPPATAPINLWFTATDVQTALTQAASQLYSPDEETMYAMILAANALVLDPGYDPETDGFDSSELFASNVIVTRHMLAGSIDAAVITATTIKAQLITGDSLQSNNYAYTSGDYSDAGTFFNLVQGNIISDEFSIINGAAKFKGDISGSSGSFSGNISGGTIDIGGADTSSFHVDIDGNMWLGHAAFVSAPFKVSKTGVLTITSTPAITGYATDGELSTTTGLANDAQGDATTALADAATADGKAVTADGKAVTADGKAVTAQGDATTALADAATADGKAVTAQGDATTALADAATADGKAVTADGKAVTAQGDATTALADAATADGKAVTAQGDATQALTDAATALTAAQLAVLPGEVNANVTSISGGVITTGIVNANRLNAVDIRARWLTAGLIEADDIAANTITGGEISATTAITVGTGTYKVKAIGGAGTATYLGITSAVTPAYDNANTPFYAGADQQVSIADKLTFDGTDLSITGDITASTGTIGSITIGTVAGGEGTSGMYVGTGAYASLFSPFYVDDAGDFSLGNKLAWDRSAGVLTIDGEITAASGEIGGWNIAPTTLTGGTVVLDSSGHISVGTDISSIFLRGTTDVTTTSISAGPIGVYFDGSEDNSASTPDSAAFDLIGDISIVAQLRLDDWDAIGQYPILSKWEEIAGKRSYKFEVSAAGGLRFTWSVDGTAELHETSLPTLDINDFDNYWVGVSMDVSGFTLRFWKSLDGTTWTQVDSDQTGAATSIYSGSADVVVAALTAGSGAQGQKPGVVSDVMIYSGVGAHTAPGQGTLIGHFQGHRASFTDAQSNDWTINGTDWIWAPGGGGFYADASGRFGIGGNILYSPTDGLSIAGDIKAQAFTLLDGTAEVGELGQYVASDASNASALYMRSHETGMTDGLLGWTDTIGSLEPRVFLVGPSTSTIVNDHARVVLTEQVGQLIGPTTTTACNSTMAVGAGDGLTYATRLEAYWGAYRNAESAVARLYVADDQTFVRNFVLDADNWSLDGSGVMTVFGKALNANGTADAPSVTFTGDTNTGMYWESADKLAFSVGGVRKMYLNANWMSFDDGTDGTALINVHNGTSSAGDPAYSFNGDGNTGMYWAGADDLRFTTGGTQNLRLYGGHTYFGTAGASYIHTSGYSRMTAGSASAPSHSFSTDPNSGFYSPAGDQIGVSCGNSTTATFNTAGLRMGSASTGQVFLADLVGTASIPNYTFYGDLNTGIYRSGTDQVAITCGGGWTAVFKDDAQHIIRGGAALTTSGGAGSVATLLLRSYDTTTGKGQLAGISYQAQYSTDRHVTARVWQPNGDALTYRNWENTAWVPLLASAFTVSSSKREKNRIRTARGERGLLDYAIPGERSLAFDQYKKLRPVLFDDTVMHKDWFWDYDLCPVHETRSECEDADCAQKDATAHQHICDERPCPGTNERPCWDIELHVDRVGLIAEEVALVYPKAVPKYVGLPKDYLEGSEDEHFAGGVIGLDTHVLHTETINVVQYLIETVEELKAEIDNLKRV